ncbi:nitrite reductase small subunit NirD [Streptomyces sp. NPDC013489]|uniref:nitrite reductase small subunit NirD n=1 Tax=Streptomyces sp. NPDC013489 TaxID=3155606 RepID=UPI0033CC9D20
MTTLTTPATPPSPRSPRSPATAILQISPGPGSWVTVCEEDRLTPGRGVAALLPDGRQVAVFRDRSGRTYAIDNRDPFTGAQVLSRGLVGTAEGRPFVASPLLKQRFDLESGRCLDDEEVAVAVYPVQAK